MSSFISDETRIAVRHDMASYGLPLSDAELAAISADQTIAPYLESGDLVVIDQRIAEIFAAYYSHCLTLQDFTDLYGIWIRIRKNFSD